MMGAKNFVSDKYALIFNIRGSKKGNRVKVFLNSMDLYDVTLYKVRNYEAKIVKEEKGIYNTMLKKTLESMTGLYTNL